MHAQREQDIASARAAREAAVVEHALAVTEPTSTEGISSESFPCTCYSLIDLYCLQLSAVSTEPTKEVSIGGPYTSDDAFSGKWLCNVY